LAFEAALLLRIVQLPAEQRVNLTEIRDDREKVVAQVEKMFKGSIGLAQARKAGLHFYDGLMVQMRSTGSGLWADRWLFEQLPELRGLQAAVLQSQVQQNVPCLNAEVDKMAPSVVVMASRAINAAQAFQTAELLGLPPLAIPDQKALRLTILEGLSLRAAAAQLQISPMAVQRAQKKALAALRQQLVGAG
jgi:predicted DNA-binding protein (UPF0251 family)